MSKSSAEIRAEILKPQFNRLVFITGLLITLMGFGGVIGCIFHIPWLRSYLTNGQGGQLALSTAISFIFLGVAIQTILDSTPYDQKPAWLWPVRIISLIIPAGIGLYWLMMNILNPGFEPLDIGTFGVTKVPFLTAATMTLLVLALLVFFLKQHQEAVVSYGVGILAFMILNMGILTLTGYLYQLPLLYSIRMSLPTGIMASLSGLILLIGTLPYYGLLLPILSSYSRARNMAGLSIGLGLLILFLGLNGIALMMQYPHVDSTRGLTLSIRHIYTLAIIAINLVAILVIMLGLRAARYLSKALYFAQNQAQSIERETVLRKIIQYIHAQLNIDEIFQHISEELGIYFKADHCFISRYDPITHQLKPPTREYRSSLQIPSMVGPEQFISEHSHAIIHQMFRQSEPFEFDRDTPDISKQTAAYLDSGQALSGLGCPISYQYEPLAILFIHQASYNRIWSEKEKSFMQEVATQTAVAIYQATLV